MKIKDKILIVSGQIKDLENELRTLYKICPHDEEDVILVESFAYENTPKIKCKACGKISSRRVNAEELKKVYKEYLNWREECEVSEEYLEIFCEQNPDGF